MKRFVLISIFCITQTISVYADQAPNTKTIPSPFLDTISISGLRLRLIILE